MTLLLAFGLAFLGLAVFLVSEVATQPARERHGSIRRAANYGKNRRPTSIQAHEGFGERVLEPLKMNLAKGVLKANPRASVAAVSTRLMGAGLGRKISPTTFLAGKGIGAVGGFLAGLFFGGIAAGGALGILAAIVAGVLGFIVPDVVVSLAARRRRDTIRAELPDALDLLAVSVEAGLAFDGAIAKLTEHMAGPLVDEFGLVLGEMRIGESRSNALQKMVQRVEAPEIASFVRAIIQADQLGISLGRILRVQATDTRNKRQAAAEEKAMKAPIKMLFPTALFIFPAMFIIILGPAFLNLEGIFV
jgi:tight adherence protein C